MQGSTYFNHSIHGLHIPSFDYNIKWRCFKSKKNLCIYLHSEINVHCRPSFQLILHKTQDEKTSLVFHTIPIDNPINLNHLDSWCVMSWLFDTMHHILVYMDYIHELISW
jgi:hypothetical protein